MRELLDPSRDPDVALPADDELLGDLTAPKWKILSGGKIQVESKDEIRKRIGRSTDAGDAVVQSFWQEGVGANAWIDWARKKAEAEEPAPADAGPEPDTEDPGAGPPASPSRQPSWAGQVRGESWVSAPLSVTVSSG